MVQFCLDGMSVAVLGGDEREVFLAVDLLSMGAKVTVCGLPEERLPDAIKWYPIPDSCLEGAKAVILPARGVDESGLIYSPHVKEPLALTEDLVSKFPADTLVFVGVAGPFLKNLLIPKGFRLIELMRDNEVAILNSIPTAEGAVQLAMEMMATTIHGSSAFVIGFGRTGTTLARLLSAMGAKTTVIARRNEHLARIYEMGLRPVHHKEMPLFIGDADVIFNTVPALVLTEQVLEKVSVHSLIIDLASPPGGTDFVAAKRLGIRAMLAPGLPGKVAPKTAGSILAKAIARTLTGEMTT